MAKEKLPVPPRRPRETIFTVDETRHPKAPSPQPTPREITALPSPALPPTKPRSPVPGFNIGVRLQPELLDRLDRARGGRTRPDMIRAILELRLPK